MHGYLGAALSLVQLPTSVVTGSMTCRQGKASFGDAGVFVEKYVQRARHIEIQIFGDGKGAIVALGERECSIQRRHQKVVEESPSPYVGARPPMCIPGVLTRNVQPQLLLRSGREGDLINPGDGLRIRGLLDAVTSGH